MRPLGADALVLNGRYRLVRQLGEGGMGVVWEAVDREHRPCAVKFLLDGSDQEAKQRLLREAEAARAIHHPNVVGIHAIETDESGAPAIVMELLRGESLGARLERDAPLSPGQTAAILCQVAAGVQAAHDAGVVHRDLKPDNVFLYRDANGATGVKVLDFGIAKPMASLDGRALTTTGTLVGTPQYMSPEQAGGERDLDARTDVWSLAVIAFECLTKRVPLTGDNYGQVLTKLIRLDVARLAETGITAPADLVQAIDDCLVPRRLRPASVAELGAAFARHADAAIALPPVGVMRPDAAGPETTSATRVYVREPEAPGRRAATVVVAALGALCIAGVAAAVALRGHGRIHADEPTTTRANAGAGVVVAAPSATATAETPAGAAGITSAPGAASAVGSTSARSAAAAKPRASSAASGTRAPVRLQGGVAGDIPF